MNAITIYKDGTSLNPEKGRGADILASLGTPVILEDGFTLMSFVRLVKMNPDLARLGETIAIVEKDYGDFSDGELLPPGLDRLELTKSVEMIGFPGPVRLEIYSSVRGVRNGEASDIRHEPVETMLAAPICLGKLRHVIFGDKIEELVFDTTFTLFELVDALAWELGFHNAPLACAFARS